MPSKPAIDSFTQSWNKTVEWAKQNKIPYQAYYPVYQMDSQRLLSGTPMSESERIRAVQAAAGLNVSTALPTDAPNPTDIVGNIRTNAGNIFTGLEPQHLVSNIWDTVTNTIEHPSNVSGAVEDFGKILNPLGNQKQTQNAIQSFDKHILAPNSILSWVPGFYDAAIFSGNGGVSKLAENPITSLLDVIPMGKAVPQALADSVHGEAVASRLGVTTDGLRKMDSIQLSYRLMKSLPLPGGKNPNIIADAAGNPVGIRPMRIGERINAFRNAAGIGKEQGDLNLGAVIKEDQGTRLAENIAGPAIQALSSLKDDQAQMAIEALANDHRPEMDVLNDSKYPEPVKAALEKVYSWAELRRQTKMQAGELVAIPTQFGIEDYSTRPGSSGAVVVKALQRSQDAQATLDKAARPLDGLIYKTQSSDRRMQGAFNVLEQQTAAIYGSIKRSIPELNDDQVASQLRSTLPHAERWDRAVAEQTPLLRNLLGLPPEVSDAARRLHPDLPPSVRLTLHHVNAMRDLFSPGGLLDQMAKAYRDQDWVGLSQYSKLAMRKFNSKVFEHIPTKDNAFLFKVKQVTKNIHDYAVQREKDVNAMNKLLNGTRHGEIMANGKFARTSILALSKKAHDAHQAFLKAAIDHPPDVWRNVFLDKYVDKVMADERSAEIVDRAAKSLVERGYQESAVEKMRQDPRTLVELVVRSSKNSLENPMMPDIDVALSKELQQNAYEEVASLRARGQKPAYIPAIRPQDVPAELSYNVRIGDITPKAVASTFARTFDFTGSIYDVQAAILKDTKDEIQRDITTQFVNDYVKPFLRDTGETNEIVQHYVQDEIAHHALQHMETGIRQETVDSLVQTQIDKLGYISYDPESIFGGLSAAKLDKPYYINADLAKALEQISRKFQLPGKWGKSSEIWDKGTQIFRFSILGLSPRYTAHILFGGTWLLAARGHLSMVAQLRAGWHVATTGNLPDDVLARFPHAQEHMTTAATQEGQADLVWHRASAYTMGNKAIQEWLDNHGAIRNMATWFQAASNINMRFTRAIVRGQRAITYLDGAARAQKEGSFSELVLQPRIDDNGARVTHPITGKQLYDEVERKSKMTPENAHNEGMKAVADVMGELRHMTPLERQILVRVFPFYGWTKHVLTYVLTYPIDHPYRATFLSQLATQNSADVASGLPTRIQLLMFLGQPDEFGNVSAVDTRFMDPLRDTANYASWTGLFQSLNPILAAPIAEVDPQIMFGANELYPNMSYSQLYGVKEAGPQGSAWTAAEQFVPQLTAADAAFNLSGQYSYLKSQDGGAFAKKVFESLNIPFFQLQHINLRQIAAQNELDRYSIAQNAAYEAASTGDMSYIQGYPATAQLPDPLNTQYNVSPEYIAAMTQESENQYGLPFTETLRPPPTPPV